MRMSRFNEEICRVMKGTNHVRASAASKSRFAVVGIVVLPVEEVERAKRRSLGLKPSRKPGSWGRGGSKIFEPDEKMSITSTCIE